MRAIRGGLNSLHEVFPDEGEVDFSKVMRILRDTLFSLLTAEALSVASEAQVGFEQVPPTAAIGRDFPRCSSIVQHCCFSCL